MLRISTSARRAIACEVPRPLCTGDRPYAHPCCGTQCGGPREAPKHACRQLEGWKQHKPLWQESKATVLEKFAARCPATAGWEQQLRQYSTLAAELTGQVRGAASGGSSSCDSTMEPRHGSGLTARCVRCSQSSARPLHACW